LPFDSARAPSFEATAGPEITALEQAVVHFALPHPYLLLDATSLPKIRERAIANQPLQARWAKLLSNPCPPLVAAEPRMLIKRRARRLINIAFIALVGDSPLAEPALAAACGALAEFAAARSWNPRPVIRSFLDSAEIAVAVALAYDWLFDALPADERRKIENAMRRNVLELALAAYEDRSSAWPRRRDNCTVVSNSGILVAALSMLTSDRDLAARVIRHSIMSMWNALSGLAPDGAWREGLSYWSLAMRYAGLMVAALESTLGDSFGLSGKPGFAQTGDFALHAVGPFGAAFNFGDSEQHYDVSSLAWFAHRFGRPIDGWLAGNKEGWHLPFTMIWPSRRTAEPARLGLPTGKIFRSGDLACFRNTWTTAVEARPVYVAIKGGNVADWIGANTPPAEEIWLHAQADAGTFIVDGARHRWVVDMGSDDYDLPGYFDHGADGRSGRRWRYYRSQAAGHNTLTIGGRDQIPNSPASIIGSCEEGDNKWAVLDLSRAYGQPPRTIRRGAALLGRQVVIQDQIDLKNSDEIIWTMHVAAEPVEVVGSVARFRSGEDIFEARILEPAGVCFELSRPPPSRSFAPEDAELLHGRAAGDRRPVSELPRCVDEGEQRAAGAPIWRLRITLPKGTRRATILLLPDCDGSELALPVAPLDQWLARRPVRLTGALRLGCFARGSRAVRRRAPPTAKTRDVLEDRTLRDAGREHG
jgi:hypothetical protein